MFSTVLPFTAKKLSKPLGNAFCMHTSRHFTSTPVLHDGRACTNIFRISSKLQIMNLNLPPSFPRYAAALGLPHVQLTQMCQFSSAVERNKNSVSRSQVTKPHPVRTQNEPLSGKELSMDNDANDDHVENGSKPETDHGTSQPKIMNRYMEAKEKMQEKIEQVKDMKENIFTIPNLLTISRIALSPVLGYLVIYEYYTLAASLFLLASATDVLDGWIARNFKNQQSVLGSIIDPLADKVLITILTLSLTISGLIPVPLTFIIIGRDVLLISGVFWLRYKSLPPPKTLSRYFDITHTTVKLQPTTISKYNTLVQVALVGFTISAPVFNYVDHPLLQALWYVTATSTVLSGCSYLFSKGTFKYLRKGKDL